MRTMKLYLHGFTMGTPPRINSHDRTSRGDCDGWTPGATRRNIAFLRSVEPESLQLDSGYLALALTLTVKQCPPSAQHWHDLRTTYVKRLRRMGLHRGHWVTEWQRRGVPHLHGAFWLPVDSTDPTAASAAMHLVIEHWLDLTASYGATATGQHITPLTDSLGWFQYVSKHAARGVKHYQRSKENMPASWRKTGRMWGKLGEWATRDPMKLSIDDQIFYRYRRLLRRWRLADARETGDARRIRAARSMLKCPDRCLSEVRGVSEWVDLEDSLTMLDAVRAGGQICHRS